MKLRTAIKIQRFIETPSHRRGGRRLPYSQQQIWDARRICRRKWNDRRIPYIPNDEELTERFGFALQFLAEAMIDDPDELDEFKTKLWTELEKA